MIILGGGQQKRYDKKKNLIDNFGQNDADWDIYHDIRKDEGEEEEEF